MSSTASLKMGKEMRRQRAETEGAQLCMFQPANQLPARPRLARSTREVEGTEAEGHAYKHVIQERRVKGEAHAETK